MNYYYGVYNDKFSIFNKDEVKEKNIPILTLPDELGWKGENTKAVEVIQGENNFEVKVTSPVQEQPTQKLPEINFEGIEMEVSDSGISWYRAKVLAKINGKYVTKGSVWSYARPIQKKVKVTKEQIAEAFNTTVDNLVIKSDE